MTKFLKQDMSIAKKNKKKLDKFVKKNSKEIKEWLDGFVEFYNKCGKETKEGSIQLAFSGIIMLGMFKSMGHIDNKEKIRMLKEMQKEIKKQ